jgi:uncharacterized membrane protein YhaH (DUF805 family)
MNQSVEADPPLLASIIIIALGFFKIFTMDIPRLRHIGWSPWMVFIFLVPLLNLVFQILLLVVPGSRRHR